MSTPVPEVSAGPPSGGRETRPKAYGFVRIGGASELLHEVHRAHAERRPSREAFAETVLSVGPVLEFNLFTARAHARIWADLVSAGTDVGAHERLVAATAISVGCSVATANVRPFEPIAGLEVIEVR